MPPVIPDRMCAQIEGDFVVFIIGMRINKPWKIHKWLPVARAMPRLLAELARKPDSGFLGAQQLGLGALVQYTGGRLKRSSNTRAAPTTCTGRPGWRSTRRWAPAAAMSGSGRDISRVGRCLRGDLQRHAAARPRPRRAAHSGAGSLRIGTRTHTRCGDGWHVLSAKTVRSAMIGGYASVRVRVQGMRPRVRNARPRQRSAGMPVVSQ